MKCNRFAIATGLVIAATSGAAAPWIEMVPPGFYVTDLSYDGTAGAGNITGDGSYETFRWTRATGVEPLGQASVPALGVGGGTPDVSYDGTRVSAAILSTDDNLTLGLWIEGQGWTEAFPPAPPFVMIQDQAYGSAWGLSGDGTTVVGYYYRTPNFHVQPCGWSSQNGLVDYQSWRARLNAASYDGSVVAGWEDSGLGPWIPTVWRGGMKYFISDSLGSTQVASLSIDGSFAVGYAPDEFGAQQAATIWQWNGTDYDLQFSGYLPETVYGWGNAQFTSVSDSGKIAVGNNRLAFNPNQGVKAIIWTPETGLVEGSDYLASIGVSLPANFDLRDFQSVSPDGSTIAAAGMNSDYFTFQTILIHLHDPCPADMNGDWQVDDSDFVVFANSYDILDCSETGMPLRCPSDLNRDGLVDDTDFVMFASSYDLLLCP